MHRVLLPLPLDPEAEARLAAAAEVVRPPATDEPALCAAIADCDGAVVRTSVPVTRRLLAAGRRLRVVGVAGVGLDHVDVEAARELGVAVLHRPEASSDAVAELTVALMLQLLRPVPRLAAEYRAGRFEAARRRPHGVELRGRTVGIIGMGRIGSRVGRIVAAGFGATVIYNDIAAVGPFDFAAEPVEKAEVFARAEILTLHVPLTEQTRGMVNAGVFEQMGAGARLINTARGAVVMTDALVEALRSGRLAGAALDVTEPEPLPATHPLFEMEKCILTPHVAARTHEGMRRMYAIVDDVIEFLRRGSEPRASDGSEPRP